MLIDYRMTFSQRLDIWNHHIPELSYFLNNTFCLSGLNFFGHKSCHHLCRIPVTLFHIADTALFCIGKHNTVRVKILAQRFKCLHKGISDSLSSKRFHTGTELS